MGCGFDGKIADACVPCFPRQGGASLPNLEVEFCIKGQVSLIFPINYPKIHG